MSLNNHNSYSETTRSVVHRFNHENRGKASRSRALGILEIVAMWVAYAATVFCNSYFEATRLGGTTSGQVANEVYTWFMPAGYVFSIWGIIYVALIVWLVQYTRSASLRMQGFSFVAVLFVTSCALNVLWLAVFHFRQVLFGLFVIVALWCVMAALYTTVRRTLKTVAGRVPISIYLAWLTVAVVANLASLITRTLEGGIPVLNEVSTILITAGVLVIGYVAYKRMNDLAFPLVILWALIGVCVHIAEVSLSIALAVLLLAIVGSVIIFVSRRPMRSVLSQSESQSSVHERGFR